MTDSTTYIDASNDKFLGWKFRFRRRASKWDVYHCSQLGLRLVSMNLTLATKDEARAWAKARSGMLRIEYVEYKHPDPPPPPTEAQQAIQAIAREDWSVNYDLEHKRLPEAIEATMKSVEKCIAAIALNPNQREHLIRCAVNRRKDARSLFRRWLRSQQATAPAPRLSLVT